MMFDKEKDLTLSLLHWHILAFCYRKIYHNGYDNENQDCCSPMALQRTSTVSGDVFPLGIQNTYIHNIVNTCIIFLCITYPFIIYICVSLSLCIDLFLHLYVHSWPQRSQTQSIYTNSTSDFISLWLNRRES